MILAIGAFLGLTSVGLGAYIEHAFRTVRNENILHSLEIALRYQQLNSILISIIGLILLTQKDISVLKWVKWSGIFFILGTLSFSIPIYSSAFFNIAELGQLTPIGGTIMMLAWALLLMGSIATILAKQKSTS